MRNLLRICNFLTILFFLSCHYSFSTTESIKIGVSLGLTGKYELTSRKQESGYILFEEDINGKGGILGRKVEFVILDNHSDAETAKQQYEELIQTRKVDFVIGPYTSGLTLAIAPVVEKYGYPTLAAGAASDKIWKQGYQNVFGMWTPASRYALGFLKLARVNNLSKIVIVTSDEPFGFQIAKGARKWAQVLRLEVAGFIEFEDGKQDFEDLARQVKELDPEVVICTGHYYVGASIKKGFAAIGYHPPHFFATVSPTFQKYYDDFGSLAEGDFSTAIWEPHPKLHYPGAIDFARRYEEKFGDPPTYHAASAYASGEVLSKAIEKAGGTDKDVVRDVLQNLNTMSILGRYAVDSTGIQIKRFPLIIQWQNGKKEIVWPTELQTAEPVLK